MRQEVLHRDSFAPLSGELRDVSRHGVREAEPAVANQCEDDGGRSHDLREGREIVKAVRRGRGASLVVEGAERRSPQNLLARPDGHGATWECSVRDGVLKEKGGWTEVRGTGR